MSSPPSPRSATSSDSFGSGRRSPIHGFDSSAALILVPETEEHEEQYGDFAEHDTTPFDFSSDDEEREDEEQLDEPRSSTVPPLSSISVFLYLLSPLLKLGALLSIDEAAELPLNWALPALFFFAGLCAFTRQIWYMLAKYVRRADTEEVLLETFTRGRGRERRRQNIRSAVRLITGLLRVSLGAVYLRASADAVLPLVPERLLLPSRITVSAILALGISPLCFASSLDASTVLYATWTSVASYTAWVACTAYAHGQGILDISTRDESLGTLWQGLSIIAFTFTTSSTLPLYAALKGTREPGVKYKRSKSFKLLSALAIIIATLLILPPTIFRTMTTAPVGPISFSNSYVWNPTTQSRSQETQSPTLAFKSLMAFLSAATLVLSIPSLLVTTPPFRIPVAIRRNTNLPISRILLFFTILIISLLPSPVFRITSDAVLVLAFFSTYAVPGTRLVFKILTP
ncbi:hypothetical protein PHLCEN_2v11899 [Hermanssonia centrifuga]|uniref:Uncharacterized protein n=1 Tax=Hermanssonia centrifuga TaxID=98765 RepID=A0A2R6NIL8_9APHY|nr:hypothetical protein PHLCEN_2v11899 [Hermanssonia centrifuga]